MKHDDAGLAVTTPQPDADATVPERPGKAHEADATESAAERPGVRAGSGRPIEAIGRFVIERELAGAGKLPPAELQAISQKSCSVLQSMGPKIQWLQSFVTDDKIYCVYIAPDEESVREHARQGGFPANKVSRVRSVIDPTTAE